MKRFEGLVNVIGLLLLCAIVLFFGITLNNNRYNKSAEGATPFGVYDKATVIAQLDRLYKVEESKPVDTVIARCQNALMKECLSMPATVYYRLDQMLYDYTMENDLKLLMFKTTLLLFKANITLK